MPILDAALAFALTMLILATLVTQIVRLPQHFGRWRSAGLDNMLARFFTDHFGQAITRVMTRLTGEPPDQVSEDLVQKAKDFKWRELIADPAAEDIKAVSVETLKEALKYSYLGIGLRNKLGDATVAVYKEIEHRYKIVEDKATEQFRRRSQVWATFVALVLAFAFNIDTIHIASSYIRHQAVREGVTAEMEKIAAAYETLSEDVDDAEGDMPLTEMGEAIGDIRHQLDLLTATGLPIGWSRFPHAGLMNKPTQDFENRNSLLGWLSWFFGIALTGVLAGCGAPFWFDAVNGIARAARGRAVSKPAS
jgi:hypothetical protein